MDILSASFVPSCGAGDRNWGNNSTYPLRSPRWSLLYDVAMQDDFPVVKGDVSHLPDLIFQKGLHRHLHLGINVISTGHINKFFQCHLFFILDLGE